MVLMIENLTECTRSSVLVALAEVQRRDVGYYESHPDTIISSSEVSALMTLVEKDLGS